MKIKFLIIPLLFLLFLNTSRSQQFVSDNYLTMPHGTCTFIITGGQRSSGMISSFALFQDWEFFAQASLYWEDDDQNLPQHFTTNVYAKYMFYENKEKDGGFGTFLGYGVSPSYYDQTQFLERHTNLWTASCLTIPFVDNMFSWDLMPGAMVDFDYGNNKKTAWGFTYASRLAIYKIIPECAIVGEYYGTAGELYAEPEYKFGIRWEPNNTVIPAVTYGSAINGLPGPGFEIGVMIFTPRFLNL